MICFFNGRRRGLGGEVSEVYAQVSVTFREYLRVFKGAKLGVFLAIALHANEEGWAWPSYELLAEETGYTKNAIRQALAELCGLNIKGYRILLRFQPTKDDELLFDDDPSGVRQRLAREGKRLSNRYLIFPSTAEIEKYEGQGVLHLGNTGGGFDQHPENRDTKTEPRSPWFRNLAKPWFKNPTTNHNHQTNTTDDGDLTEERQVKTVLVNFGISSKVAEELAQGLTPADAEKAIKIAEQKGKENPQGYLVQMIRNGWEPPEPKPEPGSKEYRYRYIEGRYAEYIQH